MSVKPTKKSDLNKEWLKKRIERNIKLHPEYHLIVAEGTKTEPKYFESIKNEINKKYRDRISLIIEGTGNNTVNLFYKAKGIADNNPNVIKHVWIVYDTDDFPAESINLTAQLCERFSTENTIYHALWSNQCIELWFLLHFGYYHSDIHRSEYWPKLTEQLKAIGCGEYKKNRDDIYEVLKPKMEDAIRNAKKLNKKNKEKMPADSAPGTQVYQIIDYLKPYLII